MPWVTDDQIERAKEVDILDYLLAHEPDNLTRSGNEYRLKDHDSLTISHGYWHWHSRGFGGKTATALNYLIKVRGYAFPDAVLILCGDAPSRSFQPARSPPPKQPKPFAKPPKNRDNTRAIAYLQSRGIDREIIDLCIAAGTLYESKRYHNCAFIGCDATGTVRFAHVRGTTSNFRQDIEGSDKRYCFCIPAGVPPGRHLMVAEAPIDAMSLATLRKMGSDDWRGLHYLSLSGTSPLALVQYLTDHLEVRRVTLCLDNDTGGIKGANRMMAAVYDCPDLRSRSPTITVAPPPCGNDYNDTLQELQRRMREHHAPNRQRADHTI